MQKLNFLICFKFLLFFCCFNPLLAEAKETFYELEEIPEVVKQLNKKSPEDEQMKGVQTYKLFRYKDSKLPSWSALVMRYSETHGDSKGLSTFVFQKKFPDSQPRPQFYTLEEIPEVVKQLNAESSEEEKMKNVRTYELFRYKDPKFPSWSVLVKRYSEIHGDSKGLSAFVFQKKLPDSQPLELRQPRPQFYTLEEVPLAITQFNEKFPETQITGERNYRRLRYKDPKLPSWDVLVRRYSEIHGGSKGLSAFIFQRQAQVLNYYSLEEIPEVVRQLNTESSEEEKMKNARTYELFREDKDSGLPPWSTIVSWYRRKYGSGRGFSSFIFKGKPPGSPSIYYALEEIPKVVKQLNTESSEEEQMKGIQSYELFSYKDPRLPSWRTVKYWYQKKYGHARELSSFVFKGKLPNPEPPEPRPELYTLEEVPSAIVLFNARLSEEEQITNIKSYELFSYKDPKLPSWSALTNWYRKKHGGHARGLSVFIFGESCERQMMVASISNMLAWKFI